MAFWAILTIGMVVSSYLVTITLAGACVYLPYLLLTRTHFSPLQAVLLLAGGVLMAGTMLWSLVPRRDHFSAPGAPLAGSLCPRLFSELQAIAAALNEKLPSEIYLIPDMNAWVAERGGLVGFGSRRVMSLGLPLMQLLTVSQFRAVVAHELAHYYGGDTALGPSVYRARDSLLRVLTAMDSRSTLADALSRVHIVAALYHLVSAVFVGYWKLFIRATQLVSRRQEYRADELACWVAGSRALIGGLRQIHGSAPLWPIFLQSEVVPVLEGGSRPPLGEGFAYFCTRPEVADGIAKQVETELNESKTHPYDSHPSLRDRIRVAEALARPDRQEDSALAISMLGDVDALEQRMLEVVAADFKPAELKRVCWEAVAADVHIPRWKAFIEEHGPLLAGKTVADLPEIVRNLRDVGARMRDPKGMLLTREQRDDRATAFTWISLGLAMIADGWEMITKPGEFYLTRAGQQLNPAALVCELRSDAISTEEFVKRCNEAGISDLRLWSHTNRDVSDAVEGAPAG